MLNRHGDNCVVVYVGVVSRYKKIILSFLKNALCCVMYQKYTKMLSLNSVTMRLDGAKYHSNVINSMLEDCDEDATLSFPKMNEMCTKVFAQFVSNKTMDVLSKSELNECLHAADYLDAPLWIRKLFREILLLDDESMIEPCSFDKSSSWFKVSHEEYVDFLDEFGLPDIPIEHKGMNSMAGIYTYFDATHSSKTIQQTMKKRFMYPNSIRTGLYNYFRCELEDVYYSKGGWKVHFEGCKVYVQGCGRLAKRSWGANVDTKIEKICFSLNGKHMCVMSRNNQYIFDLDNESMTQKYKIQDPEDVLFITDKLVLVLDCNNVGFLDIQFNQTKWFLNNMLGRPCWNPITTPKYLFLYVHKQQEEDHKSICCVKLDDLTFRKIPFEFEYPLDIEAMEGKDELLFEFHDTAQVLNLDTMTFREIENQSESE